MENKHTCPVCKKEKATYDPKVGMYICPDCGHEWTDDTLKGNKPNEEVELGTGD